MAVPKSRVSNSRRGHRRSHDALSKVNITFNAKDGEPTLPHHVSSGGYYNGKQVIVPRVKKEEQQNDVKHQ